MAAPALPPGFSTVWHGPASAIYAHTDGALFLFELIDYNTSNQYRQAHESLLALIDKSSAPRKRVLADLDKLKIIGLSDQPWISEDWLPRLFASNVDRIAAVYSQHYFARVGMQEIYRTFNALPKEGHQRHFESRDEALQWLREPA